MHDFWASNESCSQCPGSSLLLTSESGTPGTSLVWHVVFHFAILILPKFHMIPRIKSSFFPSPSDQFQAPLPQITPIVTLRTCNEHVALSSQFWLLSSLNFKCLIWTAQIVCSCNKKNYNIDPKVQYLPLSGVQIMRETSTNIPRRDDICIRLSPPECMRPKVS